MSQEMFEAVTTLAAIRAKRPCEDGWRKLLAHLGKTADDDEPLPLLTVLESNGLDDTLWVLDRTGCNPRLERHFEAWCAEQVLHLFEEQYHYDKRPRLAIAASRNDDMSEADRNAALAAAWAAAGDAARAARNARFAALAAAWAAAEAAQSAQLRKMLGAT